jgi:uncharacterized protein YybS (DUF2232 family)
LKKWALITAALGTVIFMGLIYYNVGRDGEVEVQKELTSYIQTTIEKSAQSGLFEFYVKQGVPEEQLKNSLAAAAQWTAHHIPALLLIQALFMVFMLLFILTRIARSQKWEWFNKKPFSQEMMPWQLSWVVILGLALYLWGKEYANNWYYIGSNILLVLAPVSLYYGLAVMYYRYKLLSEDKTKWAIMLLVIIAFLSPQGLIIFLMLIGIFDSFIDYRKFHKKREENQ